LPLAVGICVNWAIFQKSWCVVRNIHTILEQQQRFRKMADSSFVDDQQLRQELSMFDVTVGKITDKNRDILIKKLNHLRARQRATEAPPSPGRSPGRQSPGRAKKSTPRRSRVPEAPHFPSSDEDDSGPGAAENVTRREINLRRRTVDSGLMNGERTDDTGTPGNTRGVTAFIEPVPGPHIICINVLL